jgi:hypothetical protein
MPAMESPSMFQIDNFIIAEMPLCAKSFVSLHGGVCS